MNESLDITDEPVGREYRDLLQLALEACGSFSLVWRDQLAFEPSAEEVAQSLQPFLIREQRTDEWPGTKLFGHLATVRYYRLTVETLAVLERAAGLYAWQAPVFPEDLAFYTHDSKLWLGSIAHERDAWLQGGSELEAAVHARLPGLALLRRRTTQ